MNYTFLFLLMIGLFDSSISNALSNAFTKPTNGLFSTYEISKFKLEAPFTTLFKAQKLDLFNIKKVTVSGTISYEDAKQNLIQLNVELHIKGYTSTQFCTFPKLELKIPKSESIGTIFEGVKTVDLNTHCVEQDNPSTDSYIQYLKSSFNNHREAMIYRIMEILNMPSFHARPILIQYTDTDEDSKVSIKPNFLYQAFFLEDYADFRKKNNLKAIRGVNDTTKLDIDINEKEKLSTYVFSNVVDSPKIDLDDVARSAVLQFFIGNSDWFLQTTKTDLRQEGNPESENLWNMKIVEDLNGRWITIPQDFNLSMFMLNYSIVLPINSKVFDLASTESKIKILEEFSNKQNQIYEVIKQLDGSDLIIKRLDLVYAEINKMLLNLKKEN